MRTVMVWLDTLTPFLALATGIYASRTTYWKKQTTWLVGYVVAIFIVNAVGNILSEFFLLNNHAVYHVGNLLNMVMLSLYFFYLPAVGQFKRLVVSLAILTIVLNISYKLIQQNFYIFDSFGFGLSSFVFTIYAMLFYIGLIQNQKGENLFTLPDFWMVTGIFFYYASCFFIFLLYQHYTRLGVTNIGILWKFQNIMLSIMCITIIKGFLCRVSRTTLSLL